MEMKYPQTTKKTTSFIQKNCGVTLRSKKESLNIIREQLEQLTIKGERESHLGKIYQNILKNYDK